MCQGTKAMIYPFKNMENIDFSKYAPAEGNVLCLKSVAANMVAQYNGFVWPENGHVFAPDWKPTRACGNGLHAFLWGAGDTDLCIHDENAKWLVISVPRETIIELGGKVKFPAGEVIYCGDKQVAVAIIRHFAPANTPVMFSTLTGGDGSTLTGGNHSTLTGGNGSTLTGGYHSTLTGGDGSVLVFRFYKNGQRVVRVAVVGDGYEPNVAYELDDEFNIVKA